MEPPDPPTMDDVRQARLRAATAHARLLGDTSACALSKQGRSFPAGKFWEGQTAALGELLRTGVPDDAVSDAAARLHARWVERPVPGHPREADAYRAGGLEALAAFLPSGGQASRRAST